MAVSAVVTSYKMTSSEKIKEIRRRVDEALQEDELVEGIGDIGRAGLSLVRRAVGMFYDGFKLAYAGSIGWIIVTVNDWINTELAAARQIVRIAAQLNEERNEIWTAVANAQSKGGPPSDKEDAATGKAIAKAMKPAAVLAKASKGPGGGWPAIAAAIAVEAINRFFTNLKSVQILAWNFVFAGSATYLKTNVMAGLAAITPKAVVSGLAALGVAIPIEAAKATLAWITWLVGGFLTALAWTLGTIGVIVVSAVVGILLVQVGGLDPSYTARFMAGVDTTFELIAGVARVNEGVKELQTERADLEKEIAIIDKEINSLKTTGGYSGASGTTPAY